MNTNTTPNQVHPAVEDCSLHAGTAGSEAIRRGFIAALAMSLYYAGIEDECTKRWADWVAKEAQDLPDDDAVEPIIDAAIQAMDARAALANTDPGQQASASAGPDAGEWIAAGDYRRNVRALDVALNGEDGAAQRPALIDVLSQVQSLARKLGRPVLDAARSAAPAPTDPGQPKRLWLWKNFVNGRPEFWAFDNPFPVQLDGGDPQTIGEPCGYALVKPSRAGRTDVSDEEVLRRIAAASVNSETGQKGRNGVDRE